YLHRARHLLFAAKPGTVVSLKLRGTVASTAEAKLGVRVATLTASTGLRVDDVGRTVVVSLPPEAEIVAGNGLVAAPRLAKGKTVTVTTSPDPVTLAAELGSPGALAATTV